MDIEEEEALTEVLQKELENLKKLEALYIAKDSKSKENEKALTANLQAINSNKQTLSDGIKSINKEVEDVMGSLGRVVSDIIDFIDKENALDEGLGNIRLCAPTKVVLSTIDKYKTFIARIQDHLDNIGKVVERGKDSTANNELNESLEEAKKLTSDILAVKEADLNLKLYEKRLVATEEFLASNTNEEQIEDISSLLKEEEAKIKELHSEIKQAIQAEVQAELHSKFKDHIKQLAGSNFLALAPSILIRIEDMVSKHIVSVLSIYIGAIWGIAV